MALSIFETDDTSETLRKNSMCQERSPMTSRARARGVMSRVATMAESYHSTRRHFATSRSISAESQVVRSV